ncbi:CopG family transcriptional regulator [Paenarthrobacter sp. Z7-10]|nr:CopG family transcriptional regulator [Paenarthrobacter sp. Z7-10]
METALGSPEAVKRAVGKPSLSSSGTSPSRTVRLPKDMDAQLVARSEIEHRKPSEILREALVQYLAKAS